MYFVIADCFGLIVGVVLIALHLDVCWVFGWCYGCFVILLRCLAVHLWVVGCCLVLVVMISCVVVG